MTDPKGIEIARSGLHSYLKHWLIEGGYYTREQIAGASYRDIRGLNGIGAQGVKQIAAWASGGCLERDLAHMEQAQTTRERANVAYSIHYLTTRGYTVTKNET